jgi:hypothetical protein
VIVHLTTLPNVAPSCDHQSKRSKDRGDRPDKILIYTAEEREWRLPLSHPLVFPFGELDAGHIEKRCPKGHALPDSTEELVMEVPAELAFEVRDRPVGLRVRDSRAGRPRGNPTV